MTHKMKKVLISVNFKFSRSYLKISSKEYYIIFSTSACFNAKCIIPKTAMVIENSALYLRKRVEREQVNYFVLLTYTYVK